MSEGHSIRMTTAEIDGLLGNGGVGVISFADDDEPYSIPVSYGYDVDEATIYVRFSFADESRKHRFVGEGKTASLVVMSEDRAGWRSVVARGPLSSVNEPRLDGQAAKSVREIDIPFVSIYDQHPRELAFELYRLEPTELSGRKER